MAYDPNAPSVNNAYQLDVEQIRENLNQLRVHETVASASDIDSLPGLAPGMIIYVSSEKAYYGIFTDNLGNPMKVKLLTETGADKLDGYDAGNSSGQIPVSNGILNTNLNADMVDGKHATATPTANSIPVSNSSGKLDYNWLDYQQGLGTSGWCKLPNGLLLEWGDVVYTSTISTGSSVGVQVLLPKTPTTIYQVIITPEYYWNGDNNAYAFDELSLKDIGWRIGKTSTNFNVHIYNGYSIPVGGFKFNWFAICT